MTPDEPLSYERITVPKGTSLKHVATLSGISFDELVRLNSELRMKQTPPDSPYHLKVPLGSGAALQAGLEREVETRKAACGGPAGRAHPQEEGAARGPEGGRGEVPRQPSPRHGAGRLPLDREGGSPPHGDAPALSPSRNGRRPRTPRPRAGHHRRARWYTRCEFRPISSV